ncbi:IclR family transcriptional regulator [Anaerobacillus sp. MEB173]|uniref:IclR family transcriptional regulator n=1 Tax=Anaerobacillus sp. MEB173 TaxID=3383345 RepID=UPI003F9037F0
MVIKSFEKMFNILSLFTMDRTSLSIAEIQEELGYPKSTVFRILNSLEKFDYIERNEENHRYSLGINFFRLGSIVQSQLDLREVALQTMKKISEKTNETIDLNIIDGINRICIDKVDSNQDVRNFVRVGERKPLYLGASGKVLLAFISSHEREKIFDQLEEEDDLVFDRKKLENDIGDIKEKGYAVTKGERVEGSFAISAPVYDNSQKMIASLTLAGPIQRLSDEKRELELIEILIGGAKEISERLGHFKYR